MKKLLLSSILVAAFCVPALAGQNGQGQNGNSQGGTTSPTTPSSAFQGVKEQHPDWFTSHKPYRPCPSSVAFNGRGACLGCPINCPWHF